MNFEKYAIDSVLNKLPFSIRCEIKSEIKNMGDLEEIRIRKNSNLVLTSNGQNYVCKKEFSSKELAEIVKSLCDNSVYAYDGTIRKGYIPCKNGVRIGVCGKCVCENGKIINVTDVSALNIRIPRYIKGISKELCDRFKKDGVYKSILVFSSPGVGKTTLLRDMAISLSSGENPVRVALVDTREELYVEEYSRGCTIDVLSGYPKAVGIEIAVRTMSPQVIICDEIGLEDETYSICSSLNSGVPIIASAHANSIDALMKKPNIKELFSFGVFDLCVEIKRDKTFKGYEFIYHKMTSS